MTAAQREYWHDKLRYWTSSIQKSIDENHPDFLVANAIACLLHVSLAHVGKEITERMAEWMIAEARQGCAYCQQCDNGIDLRLCHKPDCEACQAKDTAHVFEYEVEQGNDEP